jgi:serine/threonine-protein kinase
MQLMGEEESDTSILMPPVRDEPASKRPAGELGRFVGKSISHYQVGEVLAQGHSGVVFHGRDTESGMPVALKILWPQMSEDKQKQRFVRAMKTVMPLQHPNLVRVLGAGRTGGCCWVAMEYVEGESLTQVIQRIGTAGMLDWRYGLRVAVHVARGLELAHQHQIIHRNVTPMNIMVTAGDKIAKLGDLMLAKALEGELAEAITGPGELLGDVRYMSPERTHSRTSVDGRSDIYSLGATVYALLTGRPPFDAESLTKTVMKIRSAEPIRPKKFHLAVPDSLEGAVMRMLAKRPDERFATAGDLLADLERVAQYQGLEV